MKKLFLLLTAVLLSAGMVVQAQLLDAVNDSPEGGYVIDDNGQISGRHNAPQVVRTKKFTWEDYAIEQGSIWLNCNTSPSYYIFEFIVADGNNYSVQLDFIRRNGTNYGKITGPEQGTYSVCTSESSLAVWKLFDCGTLDYYQCNTGYYHGVYVSDDIYTTGGINSTIKYNGTKNQFKSGSVDLTAGRHGMPYIKSNSLVAKDNNTYDITIGDSHHLTTTYTSCRVATDKENGKAVLQAYDGTNTLTLVFNIASVDANIGIPAKQYTVGTDVWGGCTDDDGYTRWMFKSGKITISNSSNKLSMSTSSLKGTSSGSDFDMNLTISSKTPDMTFTAVNLSEGKISGYDDTNYSPFLVSGSQGNDNINIYMPFTQASNFTSSQKFAAFFGPDLNDNYASSSYITKNGTKYVMSQGVAVIDYDKTYQVAELTSAYLNSGTFYYIHTITSQVNNSSDWNKFYFSGERNAAFSATFSAATPADHDAEKAHFSVNNGSQSMYLTFYTDDTKDGVVPSGTYDVRATKKDNTVYVGTYSSGLRDSRGQQSSYWWLLRFGTVEVFNLNETYYITQGTTLLSARDNNITFTIGTAPKDVTLTTPAANGTAKIQFTATNWNDKVIDYASGTVHKFFQDQTIALTATPASGYRVRYWTLGGTKINGSEYQNTYNYTVGSDATQTIAAVFEQYYTATITEPTNGTITVTYTNDLGSQTLTSGSDSIAAGTSLTISAEGIGDYELDELTVNTDAFTSGETHTLNADATIAATFKQAITNYDLGEWNANGGTIKTAGTEAGSYAADTELTAPELNTRTGYTFNKWRDVTNGVDFNGYMPANDVTYTAQWTPNPYTITLNNQDATTGGTSSQTVDYRTALPDITVPTKTGNAFGGYFTETNGGGTMLIGTDGKWVKNVSGYTDASGNLIHADNFELFAKWTELVTFTIAPYSNGTVTVTPNDGSGAFTSGSRDLAVGTRVDFSAVEDEHYHISTVNLRIKGSDNSFSTTSAYTLCAGDGTVTLTANFLPDTYAITYNAGANGTGTIAAGEKTYNEDFILSSSTFTRTGYTQTGWSTEDGGSKAYDLGETYTGNTALTLYPYWEINTYDIVWKSEDGTSTLETDNAQAYGTATAYNGATTPTKTVTGYTYTFDGWATSANGEKAYNNGETPTVSGAATYYAHFTGERDNYTITYNGLEGATNTNPTSYNVETETITLANPGTRDGYIFAGWKDESDNTITQIAKGSTGNRTLTATWNVKSSNIELCENCNDAHYNTFKTNYNGETVNVTYKRQFAEGRWSTMCLPFSLNLATMKTNQMSGCVYEFKYATGNANVGSGVNLYFSNAKSIEAGKCYIVNANSALAEKTSFVFIGVTIDLTNDKVATLTSVGDYNKLPGYKSEGTTIELVGTLRNGTLQGSATGNKYMGLKENKIYYPNTTAPGSTIWAYRGIFRSSEILDKESMQKMRIIVDGEDRGELIIDADGDILAPSDAQSRKFIENGVLYIEREGVVYDAQGKRVEGM